MSQSETQQTGLDGLQEHLCGVWLDVFESRWDTLLTVLENHQDPRDFKFQTDKQLLTSRADRVSADDVLTDAEIPADSKERRKEQQRIEVYQ